MNGELNDAMSLLIILASIGFMIGVVVAVIIASARIGWILAPWLFVSAALVWFFS